MTKFFRNLISLYLVVYLLFFVAVNYLHFNIIDNNFSNYHFIIQSVLEHGFNYSLYLIIGSIAGVLSGLLGIGGGLVVVPVLVAIFTNINVDFNIMQAATATSLAVMVFTTLSGMLAHHKKGAIDWGLIKYIGIGIIVGAVLGRIISGYVPTLFLTLAFILVIINNAYKLFFKKKTQTLSEQQAKPSTKTLTVSGLIVGLISSLLGLGGFLTVPILIKYNYKSQVAAASGVVSGFIIAVTSSIISIIYGINPTYQTEIGGMFGGIYIPAFFGIAFASVNFAPLGANIAHQINQNTHRKLFAIFLLIIFIEMVFNLVKNI